MDRTIAPRDKTRQDWTIAALAALAEGGVAAVRVERLAKDLGVSKGSFYWHFTDRADLLSSLLDLWSDDFTRQIIAKAASSPTAQERLRFLARDSLLATMHGVDTARADSAMQAWAASDHQAAERLRAVDAARLGYLETELTAAGADAERAALLAKTIYLALLGLYSARGYNEKLADDVAFLDLVDLALRECQA